MDNMRIIEKLPNAPLQEVIFEIRWDPDVDQETNQPLDLGYELAQGLFAESVAKILSYHKRLAAPSIPVFSPYMLAHQFWKSNGEWPVVQLGPCIMTVNDIGKNYIWQSSFKPLTVTMLDILQKSYKKPIRFNSVSLRYVDAVDLPSVPNASVQAFIEDNFKLKLNREYAVEGALNDINITEVYLLPDGTNLNITVASGTHGVKISPAIIWQTAVTKSASTTSNDIVEWLEMVHNVVSSLFKSMLKDHFYESFRKLPGS
ncbi:MAG: TIGR04255 family protein [Spirochaetes bacterium]|nr:MAG: TIGR04255 family protein [Spirochaetota bacterium]